MSEPKIIQIPVDLDPVVAYRYLTQGAEITVNNLVNPVLASVNVIAGAPYKTSLAREVDLLEEHLGKLRQAVETRDALRELYVQSKENYNG